MSSFLKQLEEIIKNRRHASPESSYTAKLFSKGQDAILQKVGEEAVEYIIDSKNRDRERAISEGADLMFHWLVSLVEQGLSLEDIEQELERRHNA